MGWDAFSSAKYNWDKEEFENPKIGRFFINAAKDIIEKYGYADWGLGMGLLDERPCARMLLDATHQNTYDENGWSVEQVREYNRKANWNFYYEDDDAWAYWSARRFLKICAHCNLSIRFSY